MQETFLLKILSKVVLFLVVEFIYSAIKMTFQKKEKPRRRRFANFKKFAFGVWGNTNKHGKGYPFPLLAISAEPYLYTILYNFHLFTNYLFYSKK